MGAVGKVVIDPDGQHIWAVVRCERLEDPSRFGDECRDSKTDPIVQFGADGKVTKTFGGGVFIWPHGLDVDREGNVWVTEAVATNRIPKGDKRGHIVVKFSPAGKVLLTLGTPGVEGSGPDHFTSPSDVAVAANGDIFVADGHGETGNNRIVQFSKDGKFIKAWGKTGWAPGEFHACTPSPSIAGAACSSATAATTGSRSSIRTASRSRPWTQFGTPSGIAFDDKDQIYVADSESDDVKNPGWEEGIRIGDAKTGWVNAFILFPWGDPRKTAGNGAEFVAVDRDGNIYGGEPAPKRLQKYVRVRP